MKDLIFDYISGVVIEATPTQAKQVMNDKKEEYKDKNAVYGRDFIHSYKVWFIYDLDQPRNISHATLEIAVEDYLSR